MAYISLDGRRYFLFSYVTKEEASECYQSVQSKRDEILVRLRDAEEKQRALRTYVSNPAIGRKYSSEFKGISWHRVAKKWQSYIEFSDKTRRTGVNLGSFVNELEAKYVWDAVNLHRKEIKTRLKEIDDKVERTTLVKTYIPKHITIE